MPRFKMERISVPQFAILQNKPTDKGFYTKVHFRTKYDKENHLVALDVRYEFREYDEVFMVLAVMSEFSVHPYDWELCTQKGVTTIPQETIGAMFIETHGAARGILHCKKEGSALSGMVLPMLDYANIVRDDLRIR